MKEFREALGSASVAIARLPGIEALLDSPVVPLLARGAASCDIRLSGVVGWGCRPTTRKARDLAESTGLPYISIEDGFLRSFGTGERFPPLSLVVDAHGTYYDCSRTSTIEALLNSPADLASDQPAAGRARRMVLSLGLSKYNMAPGAISPPAGRGGTSREDPAARGVLVIDQTANDLSIGLGGGGPAAFREMLEAARTENPTATLYVKTHPEVSIGRKRGHLTHVRDDERTVVLREPIDPLGLIAQMDRVYVVTSTMGFEALLAGKPVTCFGVPWYAGWGVTDDRVTDSPAWARRTRRRSVDDLFAAAYMHATRYLDPETHQRGTIFDVMGWLVRQREMADRLHGASREGRVIAVGLRRWKAAHLRPFLGLHPERVLFLPTTGAVQALRPREGDALACWGADPPPGLESLAACSRARLMRMEDGFFRSVGLGSDLIAPRSLVLDERGIHFDATRPSDLEAMLNAAAFTPDEIAQAQQVRRFIVEQRLTKYNIEPSRPPRWPVPAGRRVVLVPGQVEDDASIRLGCTALRTHQALLQAVRAARPDAFIVYKPHPDVASGNRRGRLSLQVARRHADHVETLADVVSCIEACDEVHTLTSQAGFDALLRGKPVVTYGQPFYAGWGLTEDRCADGPALARRQRRLTLDELVAGALLRYPLYWDPALKGYTTCMAVLRQLAAERDALARDGRLHRLHAGWLRRQWRKLTELACAAWAPR